MGRVMLIGGTGTISSHTATALSAEGHEVAMFHRHIVGGLGTEYRGDRNSRDALAQAFSDFSADIVVDFCCYSIAQLQIVTTALPKTVGQYVFVSTCDVFGYPLAKVPIPEAGPLVPTVSPYAAEKLACEKMLREWSKTSQVSTTIVRPTYTLGEKNLISLLDRSAVDLVHRLSSGLEVVLPGDGSRRIHPSDCVDTGRMVAAVAGSQNAYGKTYTVGSVDSWMTHRDYVAIIAKAVGKSPMLVQVDASFLFDNDRIPADNLFREVTGFDLAFDFDQFKVDFPSFGWHTELSLQVAKYVRRVLTTTLPLAGDSIEQQVIDLWRSR